jgi:hypothetical protein
MSTRFPSRLRRAGALPWRELLLAAFAWMLLDLALAPPRAHAEAQAQAQPQVQVQVQVQARARALPQELAELPARLAATGLYSGEAPAAGSAVAEGVAAFAPQYPLWSDGADKQRWLSIPPGSAIDAAQPDAWQFPPGTRLWKQFALGGRPVETRYIERLADGRWRFAAYVWNASGTEALLAPARGAAVLHQDAPNGRYRVPSRGDCIACHAGAAVPVLGVSALQLSSDRDPLAAHGRPRRASELDLRALVERGWLRGLPARLLDSPPRIAAATPVERAALGYLHANCSHCHHGGDGRVPVRLNLAQSAHDSAGGRRAVLQSLLDAPSRWRAHTGIDEPRIVQPGDASGSVLAQRMASREPRIQMPPLGTEITDPEGLALVARWIAGTAAASAATTAPPTTPSPTTDTTTDATLVRRKEPLS